MFLSTRETDFLGELGSLLLELHRQELRKVPCERILFSFGETAAWRVVQGVGSRRVINSISRNRGVRVVEVPEPLEGDEVFLGQVSAGGVFEVYWVSRRLRVRPAICLKGRLPFIVGARIDGLTTLGI